MTSQQQILSKGFYQYAQAGNPVSVKNFMFLREGDKKCLLIRFFNELEYTVDAMNLTVVQMDAAGKVLTNTELRYDNMQLLPSQDYVTACGIVVDEYCTDFRVIFHLVKSGRYDYVSNGGHMVVRYVRKPAKLLVGSLSGHVITYPKVGTRRFGKPLFAVILAAIVVAAIVGVSVLMTVWAYFDYWLPKIDFEKVQSILKYAWESLRNVQLFQK